MVKRARNRHALVLARRQPGAALAQGRFQSILEALNDLIEGRTKTRTRAQWQADFDAVGLPSAPEQTVSVMMADPQTQALGIMQQMAGQPFSLMGMPVSFDWERPAHTRMAPAIGEHNDEIFGTEE